MAEAVGLASGLLTLVVFVFDASKSLYEAIYNFKSQRQTIKDVLADLDALVAVLTAIRERAQRPTEIAKLEPLWQPLECCATTCREMREMLDACTAHSKDGHDSVRDWIKLQYREKSFDDMKKRLSSYKTTLIVAFQSINIQDHSVTQESLGDLKNLISGTKEDLEDQLEAMRQTISAADPSLRQVLLEDQARLQSSLDSIAQAQQIADTTQPKVIIEDNHGSQGSRTVFGTDTSQPGFSLTVARNKAGVGAVSSAGVYSPQTLQALLQHSRTPDLALALQALQTPSTSVRNEALQTALNVISAERDRGVSRVSATSLLTEAESPHPTSLRQPIGSVQSVPDDVELHESGLDRPR
ncbi:hypothetical protein HBI23_254250 [Parastagonospora nodorum]|nr:hypothetical protein HBI23_254250 [Parastagonospora nodorum]KAH5621968.1 hypothetical protein HBI51_248580 [Parastagonospora nodorum]KAH5983368.1 hypothetical protein HBI84_248260 [Parastagonospora nodorum]KAH6133499.1 hypothetical protein HBI68_253570 [Parastagonospora nodorum]KAH6380484.1 hypothetical protein HBI08_237460 [Parastagonospora nodorum]